MASRRGTGRSSDRVRSGVALLVLITFVGTLVALGVGAAIALAAKALRNAVS